eukprot:COSAG02_NODE_3148_length_7286_cov_24.818700_4_plen_131_part_00
MSKKAKSKAGMVGLAMEKVTHLTNRQADDILSWPTTLNVMMATPQRVMAAANYLEIPVQENAKDFKEQFKREALVKTVDMSARLDLLDLAEPKTAMENVRENCCGYVCLILIIWVLLHFPGAPLHGTSLW